MVRERRRHRPAAVPEAVEHAATSDCPADIGSIHADLTKVRQTLFNLLSNASKFTESGDGHARRRARGAPTGGDWVVFRVTDQGIGMTPEQLGTLFQPFSQADASTTRKYGGTGLGLTISRRFCQRWAATSRADSEPGRGSTFTVRLPARVAPRASRGRRRRRRRTAADRRTPATGADACSSSTTTRPSAS